MDYSLLNSLNSGKKLSAADKANLFTERMSSTAHQREVEDLKKAGLNPILSANSSGATTGSAAEESEDYSTDNPIYKLINNANKVANTTAKSLSDATTALVTYIKKKDKDEKKSEDKSNSSSPDNSDHLLTTQEATDLVNDAYNTWVANNGKQEKGYSSAGKLDTGIKWFDAVVNTVAKIFDVNPTAKLGNEINSAKNNIRRTAVREAVKQNSDLGYDAKGGFYSISEATQAGNNFWKKINFLDNLANSAKKVYTGLDKAFHYSKYNSSKYSGGNTR